MLGIHDFGVFLGTAILLNLTPGQDTFYILGRSLAQGRKAGVASVAGIAAGSIVHTIAAALGLSALIAASASAFLAIKLIGAAYLIYLGARMLFARRTDASIPSPFSSADFGAIVRQGMLTNILNPKVALFFLAFMPQFIDADGRHTFFAFIALGLCFVVTGTTWCLVVVWCASTMGDRLRSSARVADVLNRAAGAVFIALGVRLAATK